MTPAGGGKVRVGPPEGYDKPLAITSGALEPPAPSAGVPTSLHYRLSTPAAVKLTVAAPGAPPVTVDAGVLDAGDAVQPLPPDLADLLRGYLAGKPAGRPVWLGISGLTCAHSAVPSCCSSPFSPPSPSPSAGSVTPPTPTRLRRPARTG